MKKRARPFRVGLPGIQPIGIGIMLAAAGRAAAEKDNGDDDEPYPVVVKKIA